MNTNNGRIYNAEQMAEMFGDGPLPKHIKRIDPAEMTQFQRQNAAVSIHDHRSKLGRQLTTARGQARNEPCSCGSGKKSKRCCLRQIAQASK